MYRVLVVLRTAFLVGLAVYTLVTVQIDTSSIRVVDVEVLHRSNRVIWIALGWIAFETAVGWLTWSVRGRRASRERVAAAVAAARQPPPGSAPPRA